jgi:hypothetical protein
MTDQIVPILSCPFCDAGEPAVAVRLRAVRAVTNAFVCLDHDRPEHPALAFPGAAAGPCPHLWALVVWANWARLLRKELRPTGVLTVRWWHPETIGAPVERLERLVEAGVGRATLRTPPATPSRAEEVRHEGVVEGRPATRSWRWVVQARLAFAADPERLCEELRAARPRRPIRMEEWP